MVGFQFDMFFKIVQYIDLSSRRTPPFLEIKIKKKYPKFSQTHSLVCNDIQKKLCKILSNSHSPSHSLKLLRKGNGSFPDSHSLRILRVWKTLLTLLSNMCRFAIWQILQLDFRDFCVLVRSPNLEHDWKWSTPGHVPKTHPQTLHTLIMFDVRVTVQAGLGIPGPYILLFGKEKCKRIIDSEAPY